MRLGLGLAALGRPAYLNTSATAPTLVRTARSKPSAGGRTPGSTPRTREACGRSAARSYGRAEDFLGQWLESRRPEGVTVSGLVGVDAPAGGVDVAPLRVAGSEQLEQRLAPLEEASDAYWGRRGRLAWK
jgi:hypothetical protein